MLCSNCDKKLVNIIITKEIEDIIWIFKANCPFCGDYSFPKKVSGLALIEEIDGVDIIDNIEDGENVCIKLTTKST